MGVIQNYLSKRGFSPLGDSWYAYIQQFKEWYCGYVEKFHKYTVYNGINSVTVNRYRLNMAKTVCEDHANLMLNDKVTISCSDSKWLAEKLQASDFWVRGNNLVELAFALGTGAFVEYRGQDGTAVIDYIRGDMIFPLAWENGSITECAFGSVKRSGKHDVYYIQIHSRENGKYTIDNILIDKDTGKELTLPEDMESHVDTGSEIPFFQIIRPNIINNLDLDCPMGISIFANAIDQIKGCDLVYDSYMNEFTLGRKRLIVPLSMARIMMEQRSDEPSGGRDGAAPVTTFSPIFDPNDTVFYAYQAAEGSEQKLTDINMEIRSDEHTAGINEALDLLSLKCGLGTGRYRFENGVVKTATEVISEDSDLFRNLKKNEKILESAIIGLVKAMAAIEGKQIDEITVGFDDSIIEDDRANIDKNVVLVGAGLKSKLKAIMDTQHIDEDSAVAELARIDQENGVTDVDFSSFGGDG